VELVRVSVPLAATVVDDSIDEIVRLTGGDRFEVEYWVLKPGRAARVEERWALWALSAGIPIPPLDILCTGDRQWLYAHDLPDGDRIVTGTRELEPPRCLESQISSLEAFLLKADLQDQPSTRALSTGSAILAHVQVGTGTP
jgi:hypothetical protein